MSSEHEETAKQTEEKSGFGAKVMPGDKHLPANSKDELDKKLDSALDETFDASDPISVKITK